MAASLREIFASRSVAVVGASKDPFKAGHQVVRTLLAVGYEGKIYPVNPNETEILGLPCYRSVTEIEEFVDLVVVCLPGKAAVTVMEEVERRGDVKGVVVLAAGFAETGIPENVEAQQRIAEIARRSGVRVFGPNCIGIMNPETRLVTGFHPGVRLVPGNVGFVTQSGALGGSLVTLALSQPKPLGFARFGHVGNMCDVTNVELIEAYGDDPAVRVIAVYLEGVRDGREFMRVAGQVTRKKPVLVLKVGRTESGARATLSHTATLAGSDAVYDGAFRQCGVVRVDTMQDLIAGAKAISMLPRPRGNRVCILTEAGGMGIISTDEVEASGVLQLAPMTPETCAKLTALLPPMAMVCKPNGYVDTSAAAMAKEFGEAMRLILADPNVDMVVFNSIPPTFLPPMDVARAVVPVIREFDKPVVACFTVNETVVEARRYLEENGVPTFDTPDGAVRALAILTRATFSTSHPLEDLPPANHPILDQAAAEGRHLLEPEALAFLAAHGIPILPHVLAQTREEAQKAAAEMNGPVALKVVSPQVIHKSDVGGVRLNLQGPEAVGRGYDQLVESVRSAVPGAEMHGVLVVPMAPPGPEVIIGTTRDPQFGPIVMFGLGGIFVELFKDVSFRVAPFEQEVALDMIRETRAYQVLRGLRGETPKDVEALADLLVRVSRLAAQYPQIREMDLNPVRVYEKGYAILDARILLDR
ncbi:MAG: acetate--CoA ligase family protein [Anaerolineae bacterium]|nr:acetate--CoA ligase family protein [Anaerolineae bacterium]MCX8066359.1 acetate--CoA ligase family protein [Anaerolineae bacterium]MDW7991581.1 acetate--CoA ligase family protein [Anaerolineae bacterium]